MATPNPLPIVTPISGVLLDAHSVKGTGGPCVRVELASDGQRIEAIGFDCDED